MKVVAEETWSWLLLVDGAEHYLSVLCGAVGPYDLDFALNPEEIEQYRRDGQPFLERLAAAVASAPSEFQARHIADFLARPDVRAATAAWRKATAPKN